MERFFPKSKLVLTGNPVRSSILAASSDQSKARAFFDLDPAKTTLFVLGGSLGARRINELIASRLDYFRGLGLQLIWQCGRLYYDTYKEYDSASIRVLDFVNKMELAYDAADMIISRAGASSVSELCLVGKAVMFIPSPNVAEDHQTKNAQALADKGAALLIRESELEERFETLFTRLAGSPEERSALGGAIKELALPKATEHIADQIEGLIKRIDN